MIQKLDLFVFTLDPSLKMQSIDQKYIACLFVKTIIKSKIIYLTDLQPYYQNTLNSNAKIQMNSMHLIMT